MDGADELAYKELLRVIKFILDTEDYGLHIDPIKNDDAGIFNMEVYSDSDYAGDAETRISITGYCLFLQGVPICWRSKSRKSVTLSSSEAEYIALSEAAKEIKFVYQILDSIGIKVALPIIVRVDNIGAIFMSENVTTTQRTKHVDIRYNYVREYIQDGFIKIIFVKSEDNKADIFTKNTTSEIQQAHAEKFLIDKTMI